MTSRRDFVHGLTGGALLLGTANAMANAMANATASATASAVALS
jgi:hypothetical protein